MARKIVFAAGILLIFGMSVLILLRFFPDPRKPADYLVIGTMATLFCILLVFIVVISTRDKGANTFYKRRR